jgi:hypothetical protein
MTPGSDKKCILGSDIMSPNNSSFQEEEELYRKTTVSAFLDANPSFKRVYENQVKTFGKDYADNSVKQLMKT